MDERIARAKIPKNNRKQFNIIDAIIVFLIISCIGLLFVLKKDNSDEQGRNVKLEYTIELKCVDADFAKKINQGDRVYNQSAQNFLGNVSSVGNTNLCFVYEYDAEKDAVVSYRYRDKYNVEVTISSNAKFVDEVGYSVEGTRIAVGQKLSLRFPSCVANAYCVSFKEIE